MYEENYFEEKIIELRGQVAELSQKNKAQKKEIEQLQKAHRTRDRLFAMNLDILCVAGLDGYFQQFNPALENILGYSPRELLSQPFIEFVHPDDRATTLAAVTRLSEENEVVGFENRYRCQDGSYRWLSWNAVSDRKNQVIYATSRDVTESKETEAKLEEQAQFLRSVYDGVEHLIFVLDVLENGEFSYVGWNLQMEKFTKIGSTEIAGQKPEDWLGMETGSEIRQRLQACLEIGEPLTLEECLVVAGEKTWWQTTFNPLRDGQGRIYRIVGTTFNITDLKRAEQTLRRQALLLDQVKGSIISTDLNGIVTTWSQGSEDLLGYSAAEAIGKHISFIYPEELHNFLLDGIVVPLQQQGQHEVESKLQRRSGEVFDSFVSLSLERDEEGKAIGMIGYSTDISDRKHQEAALQEQARLSQFRAAIDSTLAQGHSLPKMLQDCTEAIVTYLDAAFARIWLLNENVLELQASAGMYTHRDGPHSRVPVGQLKIGLIAQERQPHLTNSVQTDPRVSNKEWAKREGMVAFAGYPLSVGQELLGVMALFARHPLSDSTKDELALIATEISLGLKRQQAEASLRRSEAQLRETLHELQRTPQLIQSEKMSSLGKMVAGVAHEINNPISFIYSNVDHAKEYLQDLLHLIKIYQQEYPHPTKRVEDTVAEIDLEFIVEDLEKLLLSMKSGAERIRNIVLSLRNFSRLDESSMKPVDLHSGIESTLLIVQHRLHSIEVIKEYGKLPQVTCYASELNQVFLHILNNAIDALLMIKTTSPQIIIRTDVTKSERVKIAIADNGPGMSAEVRSRIFDPFFTTKPVGSGTGLGLAVSYQIVVEKHGGSLTCISSPGQGTEFIIEIPICPTAT